MMSTQPKDRSHPHVHHWRKDKNSAVCLDNRILLSYGKKQHSDTMCMDLGHMNAGDRNQLLKATPGLGRSRGAGDLRGLRLKNREMILRCQVSS